MPGARELVRARRRADQLAEVTDSITAALPGLQSEDLAARLDTARAASGIPLRELAEHLATHPDALTSGDPRCPLVVIRLAGVLHAAGYAAVLPPGCARCGKLLAAADKPGVDGSRICQMCWVRTRLGTCGRCGRTGVRIAARRHDGGICYPCYRRDPDVIEACGGCGRQRMPVTRLADGAPLCEQCWRAPEHLCRLCGERGPAAITDSGGALCHSCYRRSGQPRRVCGRCGRLRPIARRATADSPDLCGGCNRGPEATCAGCGRIRPSRPGRDGARYCNSCRPRPTETCQRCGRSRGVHARWPIGPLCRSCHTHLLDQPAGCPNCGQTRVLVARDSNRNPICGPCAGVDLDPRCRTCGRPGRHYNPDVCAACVAAARIRALLSGPDGRIAVQLQPVADAFTADDSPRTLIRWIDSSSSAKLLAQLAAAGRPLSHELLDELPPSRHECYLRALLVHTGVLPDRDDDIERLPAWLEAVLAGRPTGHARLVRPYVHWYLLRRARRRAAARRQPASAGSHLRTQVNITLGLLAWLDDEHLTLDRLDQAALDRWLAAGNSSRYTISVFLKWAASRRLTPQLAVPTSQRPGPARVLDETERWTLLRRCLTDDTLPLDTRAAAALLLLYGLPLSRIRQLTVDQLDTAGTSTFLNLGRHRLLLPPRLAALLHQLAESPRTRARLAAATPHHWLFPGLTPGRPASQSDMGMKVRGLGINARPARNAALIALAGELPASVLADLIGLSTTAAIHWCAIARRDWTGYLAARITGAGVAGTG